ncbi:S8 family serine peptidase [Streptomyces sp. NPDC050560]|uniref:S8 family serine peptidase n=1 Tax=Streptomyces sp. NPDC050560 TaxID=3365630 RepID=UPI00379393F7
MGICAAAALGQSQGAAAFDVQAEEWHLTAMHADELWKVSTGEGVKVAVIDTGVNDKTPALKGQVLTDNVPAESSRNGTDDFKGHGTTMAELIAGTGAGGGIKGLAPGSKIIPFRMDDSKAGKKGLTSADAIRAAADSDARIINMSFGADYYGQDEREAVAYAEKKGKLLFASAGNDGEDHDNFFHYPAAYPGVVGVAAADKSGKVGKFSQSGDFVSLASPGLNEPIWCDTSFKSYCPSQGTSQASAIASAAAALIWSIHPKWTANQVLNVMLDTAGRDWPKDEPSKYLGYGLVRPAPNLLDGKGDPGPADINPLTGRKTTGSTPDKSGTSESPAASQAPKGGKGPGSVGDGQSAGEDSAASESDSSGSGRTWLIVGIVAAVVVIGGGAFAFARRGRAN